MYWETSIAFLSRSSVSEWRTELWNESTMEERAWPHSQNANMMIISCCCFFYVIDIRAQKDLNCAWADLGSQSGKRIEDNRQHTTCIYISSTGQISYVPIIVYEIGWPKCKFIPKTPPFFQLCLAHVRIDTRLSPPSQLPYLYSGVGEHGNEAWNEASIYGIWKQGYYTMMMQSF